MFWNDHYSTGDDVRANYILLKSLTKSIIIIISLSARNYNIYKNAHWLRPYFRNHNVFNENVKSSYKRTYVVISSSDKSSVLYWFSGFLAPVFWVGAFRATDIIGNIILDSYKVRLLYVILAKNAVMFLFSAISKSSNCVRKRLTIYILRVKLEWYRVGH